MTAPILKHYHPDRESILDTDASDGVVSGILTQKQKDDLWQPVAYYSKTMQLAECNYAIHDKELLAIVRAFKEWHIELEGLQQPLWVYLDYKALEYFITTKNLSARQACQAELLFCYYFIIMYQPGKKNQKADALTRREDDVKTQDQVKKKACQQVMLLSANLDQQIKEELRVSSLDLVALVDQILKANQEHESLGDLCAKA